MNKKQIFGICIFFLLVLSLNVHAKTIGISVTPSIITVDDGLVGTTLEKKLTLFNSGDDTQIIDLTVDGELSSWVTFSNSQVSIPSKKSTNVDVEITIPRNAQKREHESHILIQPATNNDGTIQGANLGVFLGISSKLLVTPTDEEMVEIDVQKIVTRDVDVGNSAVFTIELTNAGNTLTRPKIEIDIKKKGVIFDSVSYSRKVIPVGNNEEFLVESEKINSPGVYEADVTIMADGSIFHEKTVRFNALGEKTNGDKNNNLVTSAVTTNVKSVSSNDASLNNKSIIGLFFVTLLIVIFLVQKFLFKRST